MNRIKSISYLDRDGKRQRLFVDNQTGYFRLPFSKSDRDAPMHRFGGYPTYGLTSVLLVDAVKYGDPVIELVNGDRVRMCQGGDGSAIRVEALCICESHDKYYRNKRRTP